MYVRRIVSQPAIHVDIKKLNYFIHVAELGSLTRASISLGIEQSTLSRHIRALEEELKVPLFYRDGRGVNITVAGEKLLARSRRIMGELSMLTHDLAMLTEDPTGRLKLGIPPTVAELISAQMLCKFGEQFPRMTLEILVGFSGNLYEWLTEDRIDAAILYLVPATRSLIAEPLITEPLVFAAHPEHTTGLEKEINLTALQGVPLALPGTNHGLRSIVEAAAKKAGVVLDIRYNVNSIALITQLISRKAACSVLPITAVLKEVAAGTISTRAFKSPPLTRTLILANAAQVAPTDPLRRLNALIKELMKDAGPQVGWVPGSGQK